MCCHVVFFKQKTAYEMRSRVGSSDVCSPDLELFALYADGDDLRARFIVHLSDFTADGSLVPETVDRAFLDRSVRAPEDVSYSFPSGSDIFIVKIRSEAHTSELQSIMRISYAVFGLKKKKQR